jgi:hypothetical protein
VIDVHDLRRSLSYDEKTGVFTRVKSRRPAGYRDPRGYIQIWIGKKNFKAHRLAWMYVHGEWPELDIDHVNGEPSDNRIENLRLATRSQNLGNARLSKRNSSGFKGVTWWASRRKWASRIRVDGKGRRLGLFESAEEAHAAYCAAAARMRGEFANFG